MLGPFDYVVWIASFLAELHVVVWALTHRQFLRNISLNIYILAVALQSIVLYPLIKHYGAASLQYRYTYYYTDSLLIILLFFVIMRFYKEMFREMQVGKYVQGASAMLLTATALFSYIVIHQNKDHLTSRFVVELGQNLYFVGVVLTYLLWGAIVKLRETRARLVQLVLALGIYFSANAAAYAMRNLFPGLQASVLHFIPPVMGAFLPIAWAYTLTRIPEKARLEPARVAAAPPHVAVHQHS
ncbi:MAG: hypothetical protein WBD23_13005 [Candidatus Acidiferrales bacterium]